MTGRPGSTTAEWQCTRCNTTNRRLVAAGARQAHDRCLHCRTRHLIEAAPRPVRWTSRAT